MKFGYRMLWGGLCISVLHFSIMGIAVAEDWVGYRDEIRLFATPYCPSHTQDVTGHPGIGAAPVPGMRYCRNLDGYYLQDVEGPDTFLGQIRRIASANCPAGYAETDGRLLNINEHQALFALIGWIFGGNGRDTFALPKIAADTPGVRNCLALKGLFPSREGYSGTTPYMGSLLVVPYGFGFGCPGGSTWADGKKLASWENPALYVLVGGGKPYGWYPIPDLRQFAQRDIKYCLVTDGLFPVRE